MKRGLVPFLYLISIPHSRVLLRTVVQRRDLIKLVSKWCTVHLSSLFICAVCHFCLNWISCLWCAEQNPDYFQQLHNQKSKATTRAQIYISSFQKKEGIFIWAEGKSYKYEYIHYLWCICLSKKKNLKIRSKKGVK